MQTNTKGTHVLKSRRQCDEEQQIQLAAELTQVAESRFAFSSWRKAAKFETLRLRMSVCVCVCTYVNNFYALTTLHRNKTYVRPKVPQQF